MLDYSLDKELLFSRVFIYTHCDVLSVLAVRDFITALKELFGSKYLL